jgi:prepilin-type N-terminal cleavage/methylation domain-containing protein
MTPQRPSPRRAASRLGFTLVELLVVMIIVSVLSALALQAYTDSMRKTRLNQLTSGIEQGSTSVERSMMAANAYPSSMPSSMPNASMFSYGYGVTSTGSGYYLTGYYTGYGGIWAGANQAGTRCSCTQCSASSLSFDMTALSCPAGTNSW